LHNNHRFIMQKRGKKSMLLLVLSDTYIIYIYSVSNELAPGLPYLPYFRENPLFSIFFPIFSLFFCFIREFFALIWVHFFLNFPILTIFENFFPYFMDEHLAALACAFPKVDTHIIRCEIETKFNFIMRNISHII
jgi:hypothetical protein